MVHIQIQIYCAFSCAVYNLINISPKIHFQLKFLVHILMQYAQEYAQEFAQEIQELFIDLHWFSMFINIGMFSGLDFVVHILMQYAQEDAQEHWIFTFW